MDLRKEPTMDTVHVVMDDESGKYRLRIYMLTSAGTVMFQTSPEFSKKEADYRAVMISSKYGFNRDELPTYSATMPYPASD